MLDKSATYRKSALGTEAIATRSSALGPKLRSMLILVDGKRGFSELAKLGAIAGDPEQALGQLVAQGFIEPVAPAAALASKMPDSAASAGASSGEAQAPAPTVTLVQAQRRAARRLSDLLGPIADDLCMRIERTRSPQEFQAAVQLAEAMVRQIGGSAKAADFAADMQKHRPG